MAAVVVDWAAAAGILHSFCTTETATTKTKRTKKSGDSLFFNFLVRVWVWVCFENEENARLLKRIYRYSEQRARRINTLLPLPPPWPRRRFYFSLCFSLHSFALGIDICRNVRSHTARTTHKGYTRHGKSACEIQRIIIIIVNYTVFE